MFTARSLELYSKPGAGAAAREISKAVTAAKAEMKKALKGVRGCWTADRQVRPEVRAAFRAGYTIAYAELRKHDEFGATDTEPHYHVVSALRTAIAEHFKLDEWDADRLHDHLS